MKFSQKDLFSSMITGLITGFIAWRILIFLNTPEIMGVSVIWLVAVIPVLWILGVNVGYLLGTLMPFFDQFGKFVAIGFTNAAVDFGILNLLIAKTGITAGILFPVLKSISFIVATSNSYIWNKFWAFSATADKDATSGREIVKFLTVSVSSLVVNVGVASLIVNFIHPVAGMDARVWANVGAITGSATALILSFVGFKFLVFRK